MDLPITTFLIIILLEIQFLAALTLKELLDDITEVYCPAGCLSKNLTVWGTDIYPENSPICVAAIHAGLGSNAGGPVTVEKQPGLANYIGSTKNAITSLSYNRSASSFTLSVYPMTTSTTTTTPVTTAIATTTSATTTTATTTSIPVTTAMATTTSATTTTTTATSTPVTTAMATTTSATTTMTSLATTINIVSVSCFTELDDLNVISLTVSCPPLCGDICLVYGTDVYTSDSCICGAATHAGKISAFGGYVTFKRKTSAAQYLGSFRNGIFSFDTYYAAYSLVFI